VAPAPVPGGPDWAPSASLEHIRLRARLLQEIRRFFADRGVLEVDTPLLSQGAALDPHIESLVTRCGALADHALYLQTSPEFAMKRLLAAGSGPIYQICKAFRDGEAGRWHNPEFTLLEWYRPGFDHHRLMDEMDALMGTLLGTSPALRMSYREAFAGRLGVDPFDATAGELLGLARTMGLSGGTDLERDACLDFLFSLGVQPGLADRGAVLIHDFPASQAALARIRAGASPVAERFELFVGGVELANGYHELADAGEQRSRFEAELARRRARGLAVPPVDERLLAALAHGLPDCAGVALGVDRLIMVAAGAGHIDGVIAFPLARA